MAAPKKKATFPASIDAGWATVIAAFLALLAVIIPILIQRNAPTQTTPSPSAVAVITPTTQPTAPVTAPTETPPLQPTPTATILVAASTSAPPIPQIVSLLPKEQQDVVQQASQALLQVGQRLPLIVNDEFETNDYGWFTGSNIYTGGIECTVAIKDSTYQVGIRSANGPAYCITGLSKIAKDFIFSAEQQLVNNTNADLYFYYRTSDDGKSFYHVNYNPQTQLLSAGLTKDGQTYPIINSLYVADINKNALNKLTLLVIGNTHALYMNDKLVAMFVDSQLAQGQFRFTVQVNEAHQEETLLIDHVEIRGS